MKLKDFHWKIKFEKKGLIFTKFEAEIQRLKSELKSSKFEKSKMKLEF